MARLLELCELIVDCEHKTAPTQETGYPSIRTPNIGRGRLILDGVNRVSEDTYRTWTQREVPQPGDLILAREAPIGNVAIISPGLKVCLGQRTVLIRASRKVVNPQYLTYLMLGDEIQGKISSMSNGATVHHLNMKDIRELEMPPIPTPTIQDRIADTLSIYDDLIENNIRRTKILEEMAQMLYREWFVNFRFPGYEKLRMVDSELGPIPQGWLTGRLDDALVLQRGFDLPTSQRIPGKVPIMAATGLNGTHNEAKVKGPGVVTGRSGSLGTVMLVWEDFWPLNTALWVKEFRQSNPIHAYFTLRALDLKGFNSGAAVPTLNRNDIHGLPTVLPDRGTLKTFNELVLPMFQLKLTLESQNSNLRTTRDFLLPKLISGEIPVEAADDAAAELMEEIAQPA
jgi:type I restriction enzyme S subunit